MGIASDLRESVLQAAIQGKLTEQLASDGNARDLLKQIKTEKDKLIADKKIKKEKALAPISDDEKPFEIPDNWEWCRLNDIVSKEIKRGKSPKYNDNGSNTLVFAQKCNTKYNGIDISLSRFLDETTLSRYTDEDNMKDKDIVINSTGGGTMGRVGYFKKSDNPDNKKIYPDSHVTIVRSISLVNADFVHLCVKNYQSFLEGKGEGSTNQTELKPLVIQSLLIPLPPLAEQERIVAKVDELMKEIDELEKIENELESIKKAFPDDMKSALLQAAMKGELTERLATDGTAKELLDKIGVKPIADTSDMPFDIPDGWKWCELTKCTNSISSKPYQIKDSDIIESGLYTVISQSKEYSVGYSNDATKLLKVSNPILLFGDHTAVVKYIDKDFVVGSDGTKLFECKSCISPKFLFYVMTYNADGLSDVGGYSRHFKYLKEKAIPIPPLPEQERIVAQLDKLLPLCESLS